MRLRYRDFVPETVRSGFFTSDYESLHRVVLRVNEWLEKEQVSVVNIETVLLPNLRSALDASESGIRTSGEASSRWFQVVRVWYDAGTAPGEEPLPPELPP